MGFVASSPLVFTGLFILIDLAAAALAFAMERGEDGRLLPLLIPQRFLYGQVRSHVTIRAVLAATRAGASWNARATSRRRWRRVVSRPAPDKHAG